VIPAGDDDPAAFVATTRYVDVAVTLGTSSMDDSPTVLLSRVHLQAIGSFVQFADSVTRAPIGKVPTGV
jgi:hypothetical protein